MASTTSILNSFNLAGKVAVVTGASRGLGQGMALGLAQAGADVVVVASRAENARNSRDQIVALGRQSRALGCDSRNSTQIKEIINKVLDQFGRLDVLVNNAGIIRRAPAHKTTDEDWQAVIDTNLTGLFQFCREAGCQMLRQGSGKIINIASVLSFSGGISVPAYAASKGGVAQITKALANEWAKDNIQVNAIAPGYFATDNTRNLREDKRRFARRSLGCTGRSGWCCRVSGFRCCQLCQWPCDVGGWRLDGALNPPGDMTSALDKCQQVIVPHLSKQGSLCCDVLYEAHDRDGDFR